MSFVRRTALRSALRAFLRAVRQERQGLTKLQKVYCTTTDQHHGAYLLRTNCTETDPAQLWRWYIQLIQAEAAFRTAKSDLKLRPVFHRRTDRVEAHILVCFLALALWRVLEQWMMGKGLGTCARKLVAQISSITSMDVVIPVKRESTLTEIRIRTVARPDRPVAELLARLGLDLPSRNRVLGQDVVPKNTP